MNVKIYHYKMDKKGMVIYWSISVIVSIIPAIIFFDGLVKKGKNYKIILISSCVVFIIMLLLCAILYYHFYFNRASLSEEGIISIPAKKNKALLNTFFTPDYTLHCYRFSVGNIKHAYIVEDKNEMIQAKKLLKFEIPLSKLGWELIDGKTICFEFVHPLEKDKTKRKNYSQDILLEKIYFPISNPKTMLDDIENIRRQNR